MCCYKGMFANKLEYGFLIEFNQIFLHFLSAEIFQKSTTYSQSSKWKYVDVDFALTALKVLVLNQYKAYGISWHVHPSRTQNSLCNCAI